MLSPADGGIGRFIENTTLLKRIVATSCGSTTTANAGGVFAGKGRVKFGSWSLFFFAKFLL